eukprot:gnl/Spiro4/9221_TR4856_c0_g1_i1.p1 gnl/Spiro4/9221_TR4856_c0_g1~~gnl/Spiro4/9221_TR4856_c0_g1_i1.p1  ORF type:complete len:348 (+),score=85.69 gnl/Spiro4/9221_TR4856_c0_g1_i1:42-1046(+)
MTPSVFSLPRRCLLLLVLCAAVCHAMDCVISNPQSGALLCTGVCTSNTSIAASGWISPTQITRTQLNCSWQVSGNCGMPSGVYAPFRPDNYFSTTGFFMHDNSCFSNFSNDYMHDPRDKLPSFRVPLNATKGVFITFYAVYGFLCLWLHSWRDWVEDRWDKSTARLIGMILVFVVLSITITTMVLSVMYYTDCTDGAVSDPASYDFDVYDGPSLSLNDSYTPDDPTIQSCYVYTSADTGLLTQKCTCSEYSGQVAFVTSWTGYHRYLNCANFSQQYLVGCEKWDFTKVTARIMMIILSTVMMLLFLACFCGCCSGSSSSSSSSSARFLIIPLND